MSAFVNKTKKKLIAKPSKAKTPKDPECFARMPHTASITASGSASLQAVSKQTLATEAKQRQKFVADKIASGASATASRTRSVRQDTSTASTTNPKPDDHAAANSKSSSGGISSTSSMHTEQQTEKRKPVLGHAGIARPTTLTTPNQLRCSVGGYLRRYRLNIKNKDSRSDVRNGKNYTKEIEKREKKELAETSVQTNESEILNNDLLIGDVKFLLPSIDIVAKVERYRGESKKKAQLEKRRKIEEHSLKQEEHLTDLKEFLDKAVISKRNCKPRDALKLDRKLIESMDKLLEREVPKTESFTAIRERILAKERELLNLFDSVEMKS